MPLTDPSTYIQFLLKHQKQLLGYLLPLVGSLDDAQDVLQETAMDIWQHWDRYDPDRPFLPWAKGIARNKALMLLRNRRKAVFLSPELLDALLVLYPEHETLAEQRQQALKQCVEQLSAKDRSLLKHRYQGQDENIQRLVASSDRTANAFYKSLGRIRRLLLVCIEKRLALGDAL